MKTFVYLGKDAAGNRIHGLVEAFDVESARSQVEAEGKSVTVIAESARMETAAGATHRSDASIDEALGTVTREAHDQANYADAISNGVEIRRMFNDLTDQAAHMQPLEADVEVVQLAEITFTSRTVMMALGLAGLAVFFARRRSQS